MRIATISQPRYVPYLGYFHRIALSDVFVVLDTVQFKAREWDRRNKIRVSQNQGWAWLTVPVRQAPRETVISQIRIDNDQHWQERHWKTLVSSYKRAPYFDSYERALRDFYTRPYELIRDLNVDMTRYFCECLGISTEVILASDLQVTGKSTDLLIDLCRAVHADTYWSGTDGRRYIDEDKFARTSISLMYQDYEHPVYKQVHGQPFLPYMGIVDLLFNCGPHSFNILLSGNEISLPAHCPCLPGNSRAYMSMPRKRSRVPRKPLILTG